MIPNEYGRVMRGEGEEGEGGLYASGWVKRGPSGIVGTNRFFFHCLYYFYLFNYLINYLFFRFDAAETVDTIEEDLKNGMISPKVLFLFLFLFPLFPPSLYFLSSHYFSPFSFFPNNRTTNNPSLLFLLKKELNM